MALELLMKENIVRAGRNRLNILDKLSSRISGNTQFKTVAGSHWANWFQGQVKRVPPTQLLYREHPMDNML